MSDAVASPRPTFEAALDDVARSAAALDLATKQLRGAVGQLQRAAAEGDLVKLKQSTDRVVALAGLVAQEAAAAGSSWAYQADEEEALARLYETELRAVAAAEGLRIVPLQDRLAAFPSFVRVLPSQRAIRIDQRRVTSLRPSKVVAALKARQSAKPRRSPMQTLEVLYDAYCKRVGDEIGKGVPLAELYELLTLLPETRKAYDRTDFALDILLLDESGLRTTKDGNDVHFPAASATRDSKSLLTIPTSEGETRTYYGIRFTQGGEQ